MNIGIISDTHGLLRPEAVDALRGSELIIHAGDIGAFEVLDALRELAPLVAIRGNNDTAAWAQPIPEQCSFDVRSEEHTSELQSLMRISYAVFCLKKKKHKHQTTLTNLPNNEGND